MTDHLSVERIRELREALPNEPTFLKWNYNEYVMIRGVHTELPIANVFEASYARFYDTAPAAIGFLLAEVDRLNAREANFRALLEDVQAELERLLAELARRDAQLARAVEVAGTVMNAASVVDGTNILVKTLGAVASSALADIERIGKGDEHGSE